jgi:type VI secretion system protein VasG
VRKRPYSVVLLDEVEKAHLDVVNIFYQVFDKGSLSDGEGRQIDFSNTVVLLNNLATEEIQNLCVDGSRSGHPGGKDPSDPVPAFQTGAAGAHDHRAVLHPGWRATGGHRAPQAEPPQRAPAGVVESPPDLCRRGRRRHRRAAQVESGARNIDFILRKA